ncbi:MAG: flavin reductase family protein [Oscillospiraceae bacterium]|nr:flavin reductase family protein [Oscillospiraceae bacterium]
MIRRKITLSEAAARAAEMLPKGILLTSRDGDKVNSMVIGWGTVGVNWGRPVFAAYVRTGRFTRELLDKNPEFTVNISLDEPDKQTVSVCGGKSGRDMDKLSICGLHTVPGETVSVPAIREFPVTLECRIIYRQVQEPGMLPEAVADRYYPQDKESSFAGSNRDPHVTYFGEIVNAYILEPEAGEK